MSFFGTDLKVGRLAGRRRVSPKFLATHGYMKAIWSVLPIGFDPTNLERLLEHCPVCNVELKLSKTRGLYSCHQCGDGNGGNTDLRDYPQPIVELDSYENLRFCCSLIDPGLAADRPLPATIHPELRSFGRGQIFELIVLMAFLLDQTSGAQPAASCSPSALDRSTAAIRSWPRGIFELNDEVASMTKQSRKRKDFRSPIFDAVQRNHFLFGSNSIHILRNQIRSGSAPRDLSKKGAVNGHRHVLPDRRTWRPGGFDIRVVEERLVYASTLAASSRNVIQEHKATGLPIIELVRLYESGLALCPDNNLRGLFREAEDGDLECRISRFTSNFDDAGVALYDLVNAERTGNIPWSNVLHHVVDGKLPVTVVPGNRPLIRRLRVHNLAFATQIVSESEPGNIFDRVALQNAEAAFYIGVTGDISALMSSGLLQPGELTFSAVRRFRKQYVCGAEIARCLALLNYPERSSASIFKRLTREGIASVHSHPKIMHRAAVNEFLIRSGY